MEEVFVGFLSPLQNQTQWKNKNFHPTNPSKNSCGLISQFRNIKLPPFRNKDSLFAVLYVCEDLLAKLKGIVNALTPSTSYPHEQSSQKP